MRLRSLLRALPPCFVSTIENRKIVEGSSTVSSAAVTAAAAAAGGLKF